MLPLYRSQVYEAVKNMVGETYDYDEVYEIVDFANSKLNKSS